MTALKTIEELIDIAEEVEKLINSRVKSRAEKGILLHILQHKRILYEAEAWILNQKGAVE